MGVEIQVGILVQGAATRYLLIAAPFLDLRHCYGIVGKSFRQGVGENTVPQN